MTLFIWNPASLAVLLILASFSIGDKAIAGTEHLQAFERVLVLWWEGGLVTPTSPKMKLHIPGVEQGLTTCWLN